MNRKFLCSLMIAAAIAGSSCNNGGNAPAETGKGDTGKLQGDSSNTGSAKDSGARTTAAPPPVTATYTGHLPCADCPEISVTLTLMTDSSFQRKSTYMGRGNETTDTGRWKMQGDTLRLTVKNSPDRYLKTDSGLVQLDMKGKRITGKMAGKYVLKQTY